MAAAPTELLLIADADVLIHFFKGNQLALLPRILPQQVCLVDAVKVELQRAGIYSRVTAAIGSSMLEMDLTAKPEVRKQYFVLQREGKGSGESACMALALVEGHFIASSNLKDVRVFCEEKKIRLYTTMDLLYEAYVQGLISNDDCDAFITDVITSGSKLPCRTFDEYLSRSLTQKPWIEFDKVRT